MSHAPAALDLSFVWERALQYDDFVALAAPEHRGLWEGIGSIHLPTDASLALPFPLGAKLLVIAADWCGDAVNTIPALVNWARRKGIAVRLIERDNWREVMDHYLTDGSRSIPIVIILDAAGHEIGHWGPRPIVLQDWVMAHKDSMDKTERYKEVRRWYARDKGESTIREVVKAARGNPTA